MADVETTQTPDSGVEALSKSKVAGIPAWHYPDPADEKSLEDWCKKTTGKDMDSTLKFVTERVQQYLYMKQSLSQTRDSMKAQLKDLQTNLEVLLKLQNCEGDTLETTFRLAEPVHVKAKLNCTDRVYLWIGAGIMCEYTIPEAIELLKKNESQVVKSVASLNEDIQFAERQKVLAEITQAMLHNTRVQQKKREKPAATK